MDRHKNALSFSKTYERSPHKPASWHEDTCGAKRAKQQFYITLNLS